MRPRVSRRHSLKRTALATAMALAFGAGQASANASAPLSLWHSAFPQSAALDFTLNPAVPFYAQGSVLAAMLQGPWRQYARDQLVPEMAQPLDLPPLPDLEDQERRDAFIPSYAQHLLFSTSEHHFGIEVQHERIEHTPMMPEGLNGLRFQRTGPGLDQTLVTPTYSFQLDSRNAVGVSAVLAYQRYSTFGFGNYVLQDRPLATHVDERSVGTGVRLGLQSELAPGLNVGAAYQSHIEMDPFFRFRGVYSEPGEFDIPASANVGLALDATSRSTLSFDVKHIEYSDVRPFTSSLLPNRFLALLGDGTSPSFAWEDLTVYQVGLRWEDQEEGLAWNVSWSTGRQPTPTSSTLARALAPSFASSHWVVGLEQETGSQSRFSLAASYTPSDYFLSLDGRGFEAENAFDRVELEARWSVDF